MPRRAPPAPRIYGVPVLGWIARDIARSQDNIWYALVIVLTGVVLGVAIWGLVALTVTALVLVPIMFVILMLITLG